MATRTVVFHVQERIERLEVVRTSEAVAAEISATADAFIALLNDLMTS